MSCRCFALLLVTSVFSIAPCAAAALGTEDEPEISDPSRDVEYSGLHVGSQDHDYLDVTAAWFAYDDEADVVVLALKLQTLEEMWNASDWQVIYTLAGNGTAQEEPTGQLSYQLQKAVRGSAFETSVRWVPAGRTVESASELPHTISIEEAAPGRISIAVPRADFLQIGEQLTDFSGYAGEVLWAGGQLVTTVVNKDEFQSAEVFDLGPLKPSSLQNETPELIASSDATSNATEEPAARSPDAVWVAAAATGLAVGIRRRIRRN